MSKYCSLTFEKLLFLFFFFKMIYYWKKKIFQFLVNYELRWYQKYPKQIVHRLVNYDCLCNNSLFMMIKVFIKGIVVQRVYFFFLLSEYSGSTEVVQRVYSPFLVADSCFGLLSEEITWLPFSCYHFSFLPPLKGHFQKHIIH